MCTCMYVYVCLCLLCSIVAMTGACPLCVLLCFSSLVMLFVYWCCHLFLSDIGFLFLAVCHFSYLHFSLLCTEYFKKSLVEHIPCVQEVEAIKKFPVVIGPQMTSE
jgi:hypothetical protein